MDKLLMKWDIKDPGCILELYEDKIIIKWPFTLTRPQVINLKDVNDVEYVFYSKVVFTEIWAFRIHYNNFSSKRELGCRGNDKQFEVIRDRILEQASAVQGKPVGKRKDKSPPAEDKTLGEIKALGELRDKGLLTEDEFQAKKRQILFPGQGGAYVEKQIVERQIIREIVKVPCPYCGMLYEITAAKCPSCGAPYKK